MENNFQTIILTQLALINLERTLTFAVTYGKTMPAKIDMKEGGPSERLPIAKAINAYLFKKHEECQASDELLSNIHDEVEKLLLTDSKKAIVEFILIYACNYGYDNKD